MQSKQTTEKSSPNLFQILNNMKDSDQLLPKEEGTGFEQN